MQVSGTDAWPRPDVVAPIVNRLLRGESGKMFGLRRIGKSSCMAVVREKLAGRAIIIHVDAQNANTLSALMQGFLKAVPEAAGSSSLRKRLAQLVGLAEPLMAFFQLVSEGKPAALDATAEAAFLSYWHAFAPTIGEHLSSQPQQVVLCLDEFPMLCAKLARDANGVATVNNILAEFRRWRGLQPRPVAMFFTGSIGFTAVAKARGLDRNALNDARSLPLPPLPRAEAEAFVQALIAGAKLDPWPPAMRTRFLDLLPELHAGVIQYAFSNAMDAPVGSEEDVARVFHAVTEPGLLADFYQQFDDRLNAQGRPEARQRRIALTVVASAGEAGLPVAEFHARFVAAGGAPGEADDQRIILLEDGFLAQDLATNRLSLADGMVRAWWRARGGGA